MTRTSTYLVFALAAFLALAISAVSIAPAITSAGGNNGASLDPNDFTSTIDNPLFPLSLIESKVLEGEEIDPDTGEPVGLRLESVVLDETEEVAGVETLVLEETAFEDDVIVEVALDYFGQHKDGTVYYFGEDVVNYVDGVPDNTDGSWLAGEDGAEPGIVMPADPAVGDEFAQENAPGIAEDRAKIVAVGVTVSTTAGEFGDCIETEDWNPLEPAAPPEHKFYCPDVGLAREEGNGTSFIELTELTLADSGSDGNEDGADDGDQDDADDADDGDVDDVDDDAVEEADDTPEPQQPAPPTEDGDADEDDEPDDDDNAAPGTLVEGEELLPQAGISVEEAIAAAQSAEQGELGTVELEEDDGRLIFIVEIGDEDVEVDAQTGEVINDDEEDEDAGGSGGQDQDDGPDHQEDSVQDEDED